MHSDRRTQTVVVCSIILILAFSTLPMGFLVGQTRIYNLTNTVSNKAYQGTDTLQPPITLEIGTEVSPTEYEQMAYSDNVRDMYGNLYSDYQRFKFTILEPVDAILKIAVLHEGYGIGYPSPPAAGVPGVKLYLWNYTTSSWEFLGTHNEGSSDGTISVELTRGFSSCIGPDGSLNLLAQTIENTGSCPYLYTNKGGMYVFVTDLYNRGILGVSEFKPQPEDYAIIEGDQLQAENGKYTIRIAQESDEISYLDKVALVAVDHSPQVNVYTSILKADSGRLFTVSKNPKAPLSAVDGDGKDISMLVSAKDGTYTNGRQGELDIIDLNLGDLSGAGEIKLVMTARTKWDNSMVPKSEEVPNPNGRFVQVKDENGNWVDVFSDFELLTPSPMTRTYVLDMTGKFITDDYSVRLGFYPDVRFDYIGVDTSPQQEVVLNALPIVSSDLHYRGYSELKGPLDLPDYYDVSQDAPDYYSQPSGNFTRYGDVTSIITETDGMFAIMHHGDEVEVDFSSLPAADGMERDFILNSWGYYKGSAYPTGGTVEPLPFKGMSSYPYPNTESYPSDEMHKNYLAEYNTREYDSVPPEQSSEHHTIYTDYVEAAVTSIGGPVGGTILPLNNAQLVLTILPATTIAFLVTIIIFKKRRKDNHMT